MIPHIRKLMSINGGSNCSSHQALNVTLSPLPLLRHHDQVVCDANVRRPTAPFDSSMALTILVLLTALFFMGFFSIYIRRFADDSPVEASRRRQLRSSLSSSRHISDARYSARKGADPVMVKSLPVLVYGGVTKHHNTDCPICLGEFEETESVKMIPYCTHVFHQGCIDSWLSLYATCPLCRTTRLFPVEESGSVVVEINAIKGAFGSSDGRLETSSTVGDDDTWTSNMRRINSWSKEIH